MKIGTEAVIRWNYNGTANVATVNIGLYKDGSTTLVSQIASNTLNSGSYTWSVPSSIAVGEKYYLKIWNDLFPSNQSTSGYFTISETISTGVPVFTITSPTASSSFARGQVVPIRWSASGSPASDVRISLYKGGNTYPGGLFVAIDAPNTGSYDWTIPIWSSLPAGSDYWVRVWNKYSPNSWGDSGKFSIIR